MILRASSLNPNDSPTLRVASECQNVSKLYAGEVRSDRSMNKTTALRNMNQSPAHRLEQHQPGWPIARETLLKVRTDFNGQQRLARASIAAGASEAMACRPVRAQARQYATLLVSSTYRLKKHAPFQRI